MAKDTRKNSKYYILVEAFKLFATNQYDQVTYTKLTEATKLSRGIILYHFEHKERLFEAVLKEFVITRSSISSIEYVEDSLLDNINLIIEFFSEEKKSLKNLGIDNINRALLNIESAALTNSVTSYAADWYKVDNDTWKALLVKAINCGEIKSDIDIDKTANMFTNLYLGVSFRGISNQYGYEDDLLRDNFMYLYDFIKCKN